MNLLRTGWARLLAEPTAVAALLAQVLPLLVLIHVWWLTTDQVATIGAGIAAVLAVVVAVATHHPTLSVMLGGVQAMAAVGIAYGFQLSASDMALIVAALGGVAHFFNWAGSSSKFVAAAQTADGAYTVTTITDDPGGHVTPTATPAALEPGDGVCDNADRRKTPTKKAPAKRAAAKKATPAG